MWENTAAINNIFFNYKAKFSISSILKKINIDNFRKQYITKKQGKKTCWKHCSN
jgi:hypothetical protein